MIVPEYIRIIFDQNEVPDGYTISGRFNDSQETSFNETDIEYVGRLNPKLFSQKVGKNQNLEIVVDRLVVIENDIWGKRHQNNSLTDYIFQKINVYEKTDQNEGKNQIIFKFGQQYEIHIIKAMLEESLLSFGAVFSFVSILWTLTKTMIRKRYENSQAELVEMYEKQTQLEKREEYLTKQWGQDLWLSRSSLTPDVKRPEEEKESRCKKFYDSIQGCMSSRTPFGKFAQWFVVIPEKYQAREKLGQKINFLSLYDTSIKTETIDQKVRTVEELGAALCVENGNLKAKLSDFEAKFLQMQ